MRRILKYIISAGLLILLPCLVQAQGIRWVPSQVKIGTDLSYAGISLASRERRQFEINTDIDFYNLFLVGDFGIADYRLNSSSFTYNHSGIYHRIGIDYNFFFFINAENAIYMGARYSATRFSESFGYGFADPVFGDFAEDINDIDRRANWFEVVAGMKVNVWKGLFLGFTGRFKIGQTLSSDPSTFSTYRVPAWGNTGTDSMWGLNYQIFYRIPIRKRKSFEYKARETEADVEEE